MRSKRVLIPIILLLILLVIWGSSRLFAPKKNAKMYTVYFVSNGNETVFNIADGEKIDSIEPELRDNFEFDGWYHNGQLFDFTTPIKENIILEAKWKPKKINNCLISFISDNVLIAEKSIECGSNINSINIPSNPIKRGYIFKGWELNGILFDFITPITNNIKLVASWEKVEDDSIIVFFDSNGGTPVGNQALFNKESKALIPVNPTKTGFTFVEWQLNGKPYNFNSVVTDNIILKAVWRINTYTVIFDSNGGSKVLSETINYGNKITKPNNPTKEGYIFVEWQLNGKPYNFNAVVTNNVLLTAVWKTNTLTIKFDSNGGSSINSQIVDYNTMAVQPNNPTKSGYVFVEWQLNGKTFDFLKPIKENYTLVALWKEVPKNNYVVSFDFNGGTPVASQVIESGGVVKKPANPIKDGYTFVEWQLNGKQYNFTKPVTSNFILTAVWKANTYNVTFDSNGGTTIPTQIVNYGTKITKPQDPTRTGYTFIEWHEGGKLYDFNRVVTRDMRLAAVWKVNAYNVTFNSNGGTTIPTQIVNYGTKITKPANPIKEGYTFVEWQLNGSTYNFNNNVTNNIVLNAIYNENYVTPEMFGAVGDGIHDDTLAFKEALKHAEVHLNAKKSYKITESIEFSNDLKLLGNGSKIILDGNHSHWFRGMYGEVINNQNKIAKLNPQEYIILAESDTGEKVALKHRGTLTIDGINIIKTSVPLATAEYNRCIFTNALNKFILTNSTFTGCGTAVHNLYGNEFTANTIFIKEPLGTERQYGYGLNTSAINNKLDNIKSINQNADSGRHLIYLNGLFMEKAIINTVTCKNWNRIPIAIKGRNPNGAYIEINDIKFTNVNLVPTDEGTEAVGAIGVATVATGIIKINNYTNNGCKSAVFSDTSPKAKVYLDGGYNPALNNGNGIISCIADDPENLTKHDHALYFRDALYANVKNMYIKRNSDSMIYAARIVKSSSSNIGSTIVFDNITDKVTGSNMDYSIFLHQSKLYLGTYTTKANNTIEYRNGSELFPITAAPIYSNE